MRLTPEEEAAYALDHRLTRADLKPHVQALYDRMLQERKAEAATPGAAGEAPATWQGWPPQPPWRTEWSVWLFEAGLLSVVAAFIVGGFGGSDPDDATNLVAAALFWFGLAAVCVAIPRMLYRWFRSRRFAAQAAQPPSSPFSPCYGCGYPVAVHSGDDRRCPQAGICYRCEQPLTAHTGYELTCPDSAAPRCYRCEQPLAAHVGDGHSCPPPPLSVS
jgi:hypothetical protein